ncbi:MAG: phage tail protein [Anaerolineae bacterium]|nr:phage tail protein [Anaerolineae bacterium]
MAKKVSTRSSASKSTKHIDSLSANEFRVEVDGEVLTGVFKVSGLAPYKLDVKQSSALKINKDPITIVKMVLRDPNNVVNRWLRESIATHIDIKRVTRTVTVVAVDDGKEIRRWNVKGAWISSVSYSEFNTASGELIEETLLLQWEAIETLWPDLADDEHQLPAETK